MGNSEAECGEKDNDVDEMRIASEQFPRSPIQPGRVASLQKRFENPYASRGSESSSPEMKRKALKFHKNNLNLVKELSSHNNFRLNKVPREMDVRFAEAIAENDKVLRSFTCPLKYAPGTAETSEIHSGDKKASRMYIHHSPAAVPDEVEPPRPPREELGYHHNSSHHHFHSLSKKDSEGLMSTSLTDRRDLFHRSNTIEGETMPSLSKGATGSLSKSASHGDIAIHGHASPHKLAPSPPKHAKASVSNEDLRPGGQWHFDSEGKQSVASSNDSLTSSSSVATVKSVSVKSLEKDEEDPPELPPRGGPKALKPPLPRAAPQVSRCFELTSRSKNSL